MAAVLEETGFDIKHPINLNDQAFIDNKPACYRWLREEAPVYKGKVTVMNVYFLSRHEDCEWMLKDERFVRNRTTATGGSRMPFPIPKTLQVLVKSMIQEDNPEHKRLRDLVRKAFTPQSLTRLETRIEALTGELLDGLSGRTGPVELMEAYALPIPVTVIREMVGVSEADMPRFKNGIRALSEGLTGLSILRTIVSDMPKMVRFVRELIDSKRKQPGEDILTALIQAEEQGDALSEDELVSMVFLLIIAGYETTVHLISNGVITLLDHPQVLEQVKADPQLMPAAVEETLRLEGPIQTTKLQFAREDVTLHGVTIPKGAPVMPLLGAASRDPAVFERPDEFDISRSPNRHLGFGHGIHYCLGANLAKMETRIALNNLFERFPDLTLAVPRHELKLQKMPGWHRHMRLPVRLG